MGLKYVKAFFDWPRKMSALDDAQKGRLMMAIMAYAETGVEPVLRGPEAILFPVFREQVDRDAAEYDRVCALRKEAGSKGGKQKVANGSKWLQKVANDSKAKQNEQEKEKEEEKEEDQDGVYIYSPPTLEQITAYCWEKAPHVNPQDFLDYYEAACWSDENGRPINWKRKALIWEWTAKNKQDRIPDYIDEEDDK